MIPATTPISPARTFNVLLLILSMLAGSRSAAQTYVNGDYQSVATGNWATAATWQKFNGTSWVAATAPSTNYSGGMIYIQPGTSVTVAAALSEYAIYMNGGTLTVASGITLGISNGAAANDLVIASGSVVNNGTMSFSASVGVSNSGALTNNAGGTFTLAGSSLTNNAGGLITNSGTFNNNAANTITNNGTLNNNSTLTNNGTILNNNAINNAGTITQNSTAFTNAAGATFTNYSTVTINTSKTILNNGTIVNTGTIYCGTGYGSLTFSNGSLYQHNFPGTAAAAGTIPAGIWSAGSTCEILACGNSGYGPNGLTQTFSDFTWNNAAQPLDISLDAKLNSVRNLTIKNTNGYYVALRSSSSGPPPATTVTGNLVLAGGNLVLTNGDAGYTTSSHTLNIAGNYIQTGGSCILTNCALNTMTPTTGATGTMNISGNMSISAGTLNLCASTAGGVNAGTAGGTINLSGSFSLSGGTVYTNTSTATGGGAGSTFNIGGAFTHTGGSIASTSANASAINLNGTTLQTMESPGFSGSIAFNIRQSGSAATASILSSKSFTVNNGTTFTLYSNLPAASNFSVYGTFITNTGTWTLNTAGASLSEVYGRFRNTSVSTGTSDSTTLKIRSGGVFEHAVNGGSIAVAAWHPLSILDVTGTTTAAGIGNDNQLFGQILWESAAQTASTSFGSSGFGVQTDYNIFDTGPVTPGTGKVRFPDLDFTIGSSTYGGDLYVNNNARLQVANAPLLYSTAYRTVTVNGNVKLAGSASSIAVGTPDASATATQTSNKARTYVLAIKKDFLYTGGRLYSYDHKSYNGANNDEEYRLVLSFTGGTRQTISEPATGTYAMTVLSGNGIANDATTDEFILDTYPYRIAVSGANTSLLAAATNSVFPYNTLTLGSSSATADTLSFSSVPANNLVHFSVLDSTGAKQYASATVNANAVLDLGLSQLTEAAADSSSLRLLSLAELRTKHAGGISSTAGTGCLQHTGSRATLNANANYTYYGSTAQNTGNALPATLTGVLEIDNTSSLASGGVTLTRATSISGTSGTRTLSLLNGKLITSATNLITVGNGSSVSPAGGSAVSYVDGPVHKIGVTAATPFVFPTGDADKWARIAISSASTVAAADFTAEYNKANPHTAVDTTQDWPNLKRFSSQEYWKLARSGATPNVTVRLYWEDAAFSGITSATATDLRIAHYRATGPKWYDQAGANVTVSSSGSSGSIVLNSGFEVGTTLTSSTPYFTFGAPNTVNPLPIELISFTGERQDDGNLLRWSTATETDNNYFELERSGDALHFTGIAQVAGHGNSTSMLRYEHLDAAPLKGMNYYRLKQVDNNGDFTYSDVIAIDNSGTAAALSVYPNPTTDLVHINASNVQELTIYDMLGNSVYSGKAGPGGVTDFAPLTNGVYIISAVAGDGTVIRKRFIKN